MAQLRHHDLQDVVIFPVLLTCVLLKDYYTKFLHQLSMKSFWKSRNLFTKRFLAAGGINRW
jgi:hypothetical protein